MQNVSGIATRPTRPNGEAFELWRFSQTSEGRIRRQSAVVIEMTKEVHPLHPLHPLPARWHLVTSGDIENNSEIPWFSEHLGLALETWPGAHWWWGLAPSQSLHPDWIPYALCGTYALCYGHFYALPIALFSSLFCEEGEEAQHSAAQLVSHLLHREDVEMNMK